MKIGYFECFSGASGDMILGALLDAGLDLAVLNRALEQLPPAGLSVRAERVSRGPIRATKAIVACPKEPREPHRALADIRRIIGGSSLEQAVKDQALAVFCRLAEAEARVHGVKPEAVTFHEAGAADSIADIVGAVAGLRALGLEKLYVSTFSLGSGSVECAHGRLPVPAPATAELLKGFTAVRAGVNGELVTPTGAAILTTLASQSDPPPFRCEAVGYGAGAADRPELPNVLRLSVGEAKAPARAADTDRVWVLETNVDDLSPEIAGHVPDVLLSAGALDVFLQPVQMKKSRPGLLITCLAAADDVPRLEELLFRETTTFGIRKYPVDRVKLCRERRTVQTPHGEVRVKIGRLDGQATTLSPEYEDCRRVAREKGVALRQVYDEALRAARQAP